MVDGLGACLRAVSNGLPWNRPAQHTRWQVWIHFAVGCSASTTSSFSMTLSHAPHTMRSFPIIRHEGLGFSDAGLTEGNSLRGTTSHHEGSPQNPHERGCRPVEIAWPDYIGGNGSTALLQADPAQLHFATEKQGLSRVGCFAENGRYHRIWQSPGQRRAIRNRLGSCSIS